MKALVTGAGGFLGGVVARQLLAQGAQVRSLARGDYTALRAAGVETLRGDLGDPEAVNRAVEGCDTVFHVAAKAGVWGAYEEYYQANVAGTIHVIEACRRHGVPRLIFTSSPSVTFAGHDQEGVDEREPYPEKFLAFYPQTKAEAERLVLLANGPHLATVALRPHLIWGPGDPHLVPRLVERARAGKLRLVGGGLKRVDSVYVENAAEAHLLAAKRLGADLPGIKGTGNGDGKIGEKENSPAGRAYFISNGEPMPMAELINSILTAAGVPPVKRSVSSGVAYGVGWLFEKGYGLLGREEEPPLTRFVARQLATTHWFDLSAARRDFGYVPRIPIREGLNRLAAWLQGPERPAWMR
jgi:nucleoside-diphosphate-sugar epimerase